MTFRGSRRDLSQCGCCHRAKPRNGRPTCARCEAAGCVSSYGLWRRGAECPVRANARRMQAGAAAARRINGRDLINAAWGRLSGLGHKPYQTHCRFPDGTRENRNWPHPQAVITSERWPTLVCHACGRSDAAHYAGVVTCGEANPLIEDHR